MPDTTREITCPECGRVQTDTRNFCPYCGHSFRTRSVAPPPPADDQPPTSPPVAQPTPPGLAPGRTATAPSKASAPSYQPPVTKRFRLADWRVLFGILGFLDFPVVLILLGLLLVPRLLQPAPPPTCDQLDLDEFTAERYERGLGGELTEDTLFQAGTEYLIQETLIVPEDRRLLIQPGARLVFDEGTALEVRGGLYVCGSAREPVTFTSEEGSPGSWEGIRLRNATPDSVLSHVLIQFAGDRALYLENSAPSLLDTKIANGSGFPISSDGNTLPKLLDAIDVEDNPFRGIEIRSGTLTEETVTWQNDGLVLIVSGPLEIGTNTTLEIESDVTVKFWHAPRANPPGLGVRGLLRADGVQFTSVFDDADDVGGVTYLESQEPAPGDWAGILFHESNRSVLRDCLVRYAGQRQSGAVSFQASSPELTVVTIENTAWYPLSADADSFPQLEDIVLVDNNPGDALEIRDDTSVSGRNERTWEVLGDDPQIVRVVRGDVVVEPEAVLTIEPGVVVKFEESGRLIIQGTLIAVGGERDSDRIIFTSLRDDEVGGDTDITTSPQDPRRWRGLVFEGADNSSVLENITVRYSSIVLNDASPRLISSRIVESPWAAIHSSPDSSPELQDLQLEENAVNGIGITEANVEEDQYWLRLGEGDDQLVRVLIGKVTILDGATLTIEPGVIIKANADGRFDVHGGLHALGQDDLPILFTSINDDSAGGDTNQSLEESDPGDWPGLVFQETAHVYFGYTTIRYARYGVSIHGRPALAIDGWLRLTDGEHALWCDAAVEIPDGFSVEGNAYNRTRCPTD